MVQIIWPNIEGCLEIEIYWVIYLDLNLNIENSERIYHK